jgi:hypothetical protein
MSSTDNKIIISNEPNGVDENFQRILENNQFRNIHYYAAGSIVHNYFNKKLMSDSNVSEETEEQLPHVPK